MISINAYMFTFAFKNCCCPVKLLRKLCTAWYISSATGGLMLYYGHSFLPISSPPWADCPLRDNILVESMLEFIIKSRQGRNIF